MENKELLSCIDFFKELNVFEIDVTSEEDILNYNKVVVVNYLYKERIFTTNKLYYKNILHQDNIKTSENIIRYFGGDVYWLDNEVHDWAKGAGKAELEKTIIDEMVVNNDNDFKTLLKKIANNQKQGLYNELLQKESQLNITIILKTTTIGTI